MFAITPARQVSDFASAATLFQDYTRSLGRDLSYQSADAERQGLPGKYAPPSGELLLARLSDGTPVGCVALRPIDPPGCCEMKRLYVSPAARGMGVGGALVDAIIGVARQLHYKEMRLDSLASLASALALYQAAGFQPIPAYCENPFADAVFLGLDLTV